MNDNTDVDVDRPGYYWVEVKLKARTYDELHAAATASGCLTVAWLAADLIEHAVWGGMPDLSREAGDDQTVE